MALEKFSETEGRKKSLAPHIPKTGRGRGQLTSSCGSSCRDLWSRREASDDDNVDPIKVQKAFFSNFDLTFLFFQLGSPFSGFIQILISLKLGLLTDEKFPKSGDRISWPRDMQLHMLYSWNWNLLPSICMKPLFCHAQCISNMADSRAILIMEKWRYFHSLWVILTKFCMVTRFGFETLT